MKFLKQNFLTLIMLIVLLANFYKLSDLQVRYRDLSSQYFMLQSRIQNGSNSLNSYQQQRKPAKEIKEVMTPLDLAEYLDIEMDIVYDIATTDSTMPYIIINGEYRFSKSAIDKWMETRRTIEAR